MDTQKEPRGIRNNNPLNIRHGQPWQGLAPVQTDKDFDQFVTMQYGCRAAVKCAKTYVSRHKCDTVEKFISRWAPSSENDTQRYVSFVCKKAHLEPDTRLHVSFKNVICRLLWAMACYENGREISFQYFENAWALV